MMFKLYTKSHDLKLLQGLCESQFTSAEHEYVSREELYNLSKQEYLANTVPRPIVLEFLIKYIVKNKIKNVISLGSGTSTFEYELKNQLSNVNITATDYDLFFIENAKKYFPELISIQFDFIKDNINVLNLDFDLVIFMGSLYVLTDNQIIKLFNQLKQSGVKKIIDFHAGYIPYRYIPQYIVGDILRRLNLIKTYRGKWHGYGRTKYELDRLYKKLENKYNIITVEPYRYVYITSMNDKQN
jgi:ubiquinone/menaquinone biosynthesis C-methylase UbiE